MNSALPKSGPSLLSAHVPGEPRIIIPRNSRLTIIVNLDDFRVSIEDVGDTRVGSAQVDADCDLLDHSKVFPLIDKS